MMGDILRPSFATKGPIPADHILEAHVGKLSDVLLLGFDKETNKFVAACSDPDARTNVFLASLFLHKELNGDYGEHN